MSEFKGAGNSKREDCQIKIMPGLVTLSTKAAYFMNALAKWAESYNLGHKGAAGNKTGAYMNSAAPIICTKLSVLSLVAQEIEKRALKHYALLNAISNGELPPTVAEVGGR